MRILYIISFEFVQSYIYYSLIIYCHTRHNNFPVHAINPNITINSYNNRKKLCGITLGKVINIAIQYVSSKVRYINSYNDYGFKTISFNFILLSFPIMVLKAKF